MNLVENAAHALAGRADARIELIAQSSSLVPTRRRDDRPSSRRRSSDAVVLRVVDNGPGIDPEHRDQVFDPFYTTKEPGEGTGLGLWNSHRLAELLGGRLELESSPGRTAFSLLLPIADKEPAD